MHVWMRVSLVCCSDNPEMCRAFCEDAASPSTTNPPSNEHFVIRCRVILGDTKVLYSLDLFVYWINVTIFIGEHEWVKAYCPTRHIIGHFKHASHGYRPDNPTNRVKALKEVIIVGKKLLQFDICQVNVRQEAQHDASVLMHVIFSTLCPASCNLLAGFSDLQSFTRGQVLIAYWPYFPTFTYPSPIWRPLWGGSPWAIGFIFGVDTLEWLSYNLVKVAWWLTQSFGYNTSIKNVL